MNILGAADNNYKFYYSDWERIKDFIETLSQEMSKFAKREDLNILSKQAKMFQPANFIRKEELKEEIEKLKK